MFESIAYKNSVGAGPGKIIDIGALVEGLIFYEKVSIVANSLTVSYLLERIPPFVLLSLMEQEKLEIHFLEDFTGVSTNETYIHGQKHSLVIGRVQDRNDHETFVKDFKRFSSHQGNIERDANRFIEIIHPLDYSGYDHNAAKSLLLDPLTNQSVITLLGELVPTYSIPDNAFFKPIQEDDNSFYINTNLDFKVLNQHYHRKFPASHSSLSQAYLMSLLLSTVESLYFSSRLNSEIAISPIEKVTQSAAINSLASRFSVNESNIEQFSNLTLNNSHAIREAVNSGKINFHEILALLDKADKFRHWLRDKENDANLAHEFYQLTVENTWVEKLPPKLLKWSIFTGIGFTLGPMQGVALGAFEQFILDKLIEGWKPHQFVEKELKALFYYK
ncbi:hypothetical protein [Methylophilus sp. 5]|uniref:hypothetical protein n=1 Tax=Methylophilus sp. 5 TaxID=1112274 RepID=UPI0004905CD1|nr:hypothetical protein [Methylophilus sp. 5]